METALEPPLVATAPSPHRAAATFLSVLEAEQARYLDAIGAARCALDAGSAQLAEMSAIQLRLTRRFFDAQRAILDQRARVDDAVGALLDGMTFIAPNNLDRGRFERQLDALLDEWWDVEKSACSAVIEQTPAIEPSRVDPSMRPALPAALIDALDSADPADLDRILDDLVADFTAHVAVARTAVADEWSRQRTALPFEPPSADDLVIVGGAPDDFALFWESDVAPAPAVSGDDRSSPDWPLLARRAVVPIAGVTAGLAAVMALIG